MLPVILLPAAENDLLEQAEYYDAGGEELGDRFIAACEVGFNRLAAFPESGTALRLRHPRLEGIRFILVPDFENILILYTLGENQVRVVRVLHGKRDIEAIFARGKIMTSATDKSLVFADENVKACHDPANRRG